MNMSNMIYARNQKKSLLKIQNESFELLIHHRRVFTIVLLSRLLLFQTAVFFSSFSTMLYSRFRGKCFAN